MRFLPILLLAFTLGLGVRASAQGNLSDILKGSRDPSNRPEFPPPKPAPLAPQQPEEAPSETAPSGKAKYADIIAKMEKSIAEIESRGYADTPSISKKEAERKLAILRKRQALLEQTLFAETTAIIGKSQKEAEQFTRRWEALSEALSDGKQRTDREWNDLLDQAEAARGLAPGKRAADAEKAADNRLNPPESHETKPAAPSTESKAKSFSQLIAGEKIPTGMSPETWARILDTHIKDRHQLEANAKRAIQRAHAIQESQLAPSRAALRTAEERFQRMNETGTAPPGFEQRHLNWQLDQARLAQTRLRLDDLRRQGRGSSQHPNYLVEGTGPNPLDPAEAIQKFVTNAMRLAGSAPAPQRDAFDQLSDEELAHLVDEDFRNLLQPDSFSRNMASAAVNRYRRRLEAINEAVNSIPQTLEREEREWLRDKHFQLNIADDIAGIGHTEEAAESRRKAMQEFRDQLAATREKRIEQRRKELQTHRETVIESLKRLRSRVAEVEEPKSEQAGQ